MDISKVDGLAKTASSYGTAIVVAVFFMLIITAVVTVMISEYKKDRKEERDKQKAEREKQKEEDQERVALYQSQAELLREMTETIVKSTHSAEQMLALLDRTEDMHIALDKKVESLQVVVNDIKKEVGHDGRVATILYRVDKALDRLLEELKEKKGE